MIVKDTFSLLVGRQLLLFGFVELGSLLVLAGWAMETVNMPSNHIVITRSVLKGPSPGLEKIEKIQQSLFEEMLLEACRKEIAAQEQRGHFYSTP